MCRFRTLAAPVLIALFYAMSFGAITFTPDVTGINGFTAVDKITWTDSKGFQREAYFAKGHPDKATAKGYITRLVWKADASTTVTCNEPGSSGDISGFAFTVDHNGSANYGGPGWSLQKGNGFEFVQGPLLNGPNHFIYRVTFKQYSDHQTVGSNAYSITVDWVFYEGVDWMLYAITYDCSAYPLNTFGDDSRSPYSEFNWDGGNDTYAAISGMRFGTAKLFKCDNMNLTSPSSSSYTYGGTNAVPFVQAWKTTPDRECGFVQTQAGTQHTAGGDDANLPASGTLGSMSWQLPYQMNSYQGFFGQRLTWGIKYGTIQGGMGSQRPYQAYTVALVVDKKTDGGVDRFLGEVDRVQGTKKIAFTAVEGTIPTSGVEGSATPKIKTYVPAGYNHVYRTWEITATAGNIARFIFNVQEADYQCPVFVVSNYTSSSLPTVVAKNGTPLVAGTDYTASLDDTGNKLWITLLGKITGSNQIGINTSEYSGVIPGLMQSRMTKSIRDIGMYDLTGRSLGARQSSVRHSGVMLLMQDENGLQKVKRILR